MDRRAFIKTVIAAALAGELSNVLPQEIDDRSTTGRVSIIGLCPIGLIAGQCLADPAFGFRQYAGARVLSVSPIASSGIAGEVPVDIVGYPGLAESLLSSSLLLLVGSAELSK